MVRPRLGQALYRELKRRISTHRQGKRFGKEKTARFNSKALQKLVSTFQRANERLIREIRQDTYASDSEGSHSDLQEADTLYNGTIEDHYEWTVTNHRHIKKWRAEESSYRFKLRQSAYRNQRTVRGYQRLVYDAISSILAKFMTGVASTDKVRMVLTSTSAKRPFSTPLTLAMDFTPELIMGMVNKGLQSDESIAFDDFIEITFQHIEIPTGGYRPTHLHVAYANARKHLKSIVQINVADNLCLPAAILLGKLRLEQGATSTEYKSLTRSRTVRVLAKEAKRFYSQVTGREHQPDAQCSIDDLRTFQNYLQDIQIVVFRWSNGKKVMFKGETDHPTKLYLVYHEKHFDLVTTPLGFMGRDYFCDICFRGYTKSIKHACRKTCKACFREDCLDINGTGSVPCYECHRVFFGPHCYDAHLKSPQNGNSLCNKVKNCENCGLRYEIKKNREIQHVCGGVFCKNCNSHVPWDHRCYIRPIESPDEAQARIEEDEAGMEIGEELVREAEENDINSEEDFIEATPYSAPIPSEKDVQQFSGSPYCYFDIEAYEDENDAMNHHANLIVAQTNQPGDDPPPFFGEDAIDQFCQWAICDERSGMTFVAHNLKRYDGYFVLHWLLRHSTHNPDVIANGGALFEIRIPQLNIRFIDSINFLSSSLAELPVMFGKENEFAKGFFPHRFNKPANYDYVGKIPDVEDYDEKWMSAKRKEEFWEWYNEKNSDQTYIFNFRQELEFYCKLDTTVLRECCEAFRRVFFEATTVNPFESVTIASACNKVYRKLYLQPKTIAIVPPNGYAGRDKQSLLAKQWMEWEAHKRNIAIRHSSNGQEFRVAERTYRLDGVRIERSDNGEHEPTNHAFEFMGCFFHGHSACYHPSQFNNLSRKTMGELYNATMFRISWLRDNGWKVEIKWECEFRKEIAENCELKEFLSTLKIVEPLNPRDAFFGGRTNATVLHYEAKLNEMIKYADINSLYPFVNKTRKYPIGHPEILFGTQIDHANIRAYFGIIRCRILPPTNLLHPVLPGRYRDKLMFVLCDACGTKPPENGECDHNDDERALNGTFVTEEVFAAIDRGYTLLDVFEIWNFRRWSCNLFRSYINTFLALKQQARGLPEHLRDETDPEVAKQLEAYVDEFYEAEGVKMEVAKLSKSKNPGMYQTAKLCLNSFWGKFGQRNNKSQIAFCREEPDYWSLLTDQRIDIRDILFHGEDCAQIEFSEHSDFILPGNNTNVVVAAFTTAYARLHLYETLEKLGDRVLYYDTGKSKL